MFIENPSLPSPLRSLLVCRCPDCSRHRIPSDAEVKYGDTVACLVELHQCLQCGWWIDDLGKLLVKEFVATPVCSWRNGSQEAWNISVLETHIAWNCVLFETKKPRLGSE